MRKVEADCPKCDSSFYIENMKKWACPMCGHTGAMYVRIVDEKTDEGRTLWPDKRPPQHPPETSDHTH